MANHPNRRRIASKLDAAMWQIIADHTQYATLDRVGRRNIRHNIKLCLQERFGTAGEIEASATSVNDLVAEHSRISR